MSYVELEALLAECALQLIVQREHLTVPVGTNLLVKYLQGEISINGYGFLIDDLITDKVEILLFAMRNPELFSKEYSYAESEDMLGALYLSCRKMSNRKATGSYYTPAAIANKIVKNLFGEGSADIGTVFDPCCGTGTFLLLLPGNITMEHIYGNDIDPIGVCITRINLALKFRITDRDILYGHITQKDYLTFDTKEYFDYIIGNPPWGYHFSEEEKEKLRGKYQCAAGKYIESYDVFTEQAVSNLNYGGVLSFLLPEAILNVRTHMQIREFLIKGNSIQYLEYLGDVFDKVQCPCIILQILHNHKPMDTLGMVVNDGKRVYTIQTRRGIQKDYFCFTTTDEEYGILQKIEHVPHRITLFDNARFALGIVTGDNKKFITKTKTEDNEMILKGVDLHKFRFTESDNYIMYKPEEFQQTAPAKYYRAPQKLLYRFICKHLVFAYDDKQTLSLNSCNVLIPEADGLEIKYILAILNSRIAQFYFQKNFHSVKVLRSHIEQIPIPMVGKAEQEEMIQIVDRLIMPAEDEDAAGDFEILDEKIANIYGLSQKEYATIKENVWDSNL